MMDDLDDSSVILRHLSVREWQSSATGAAAPSDTSGALDDAPGPLKIHLAEPAADGDGGAVMFHDESSDPTADLGLPQAPSFSSADGSSAAAAFASAAAAPPAASNGSPAAGAAIEMSPRRQPVAPRKPLSRNDSVASVASDADTVFQYKSPDLYVADQKARKVLLRSALLIICSAFLSRLAFFTIARSAFFTEAGAEAAQRDPAAAQPLIYASMFLQQSAGGVWATLVLLSVLLGVWLSDGACFVALCLCVLLSHPVCSVTLAYRGL